MENNKEVLVGSRWIVYKERVNEIAKLDCDGVVRLYKKCEGIEEGLLG